MRGEGGRGVTNCLILTTILSATGYINIIKNKRGRERKGEEGRRVGRGGSDRERRMGGGVDTRGRLRGEYRGLGMST